MNEQTQEPADPRVSQFLPREGLGELVGVLKAEGYTVVARVLRDGVLSMRPIESAEEMSRGLRDEQEGGRYRLEPGDPELTFEHVVGADGPKRYFFPPEQRLFTIHVEGEEFALDAAGPRAGKFAFLGVRPCELAAISVQDRVFGAAESQQTFRCESETYYQQTREQSLLIAVNCTRPGGTCFCASWGTGPAVSEQAPFDVAMTELRAGFVIQSATRKGIELVDRLPVREPTSAELELEELKLAQARGQMGRSLQTDGVRGGLAQAVEHPQWDEVAKQCLSCGNCTMVCPTCFCSTVSDGNALDSDQTDRTRRWESCFTHQFSYTTPGPVRNTVRARYRQWLRHKVCTWWEQFDCSGCVGCGRCITWCPVGIDLTEQIKAICRGPKASPTGLDEGRHGEGAS